jgi:acyl-CoA thioester hydrolase
MSKYLKRILPNLFGMRNNKSKTKSKEENLRTTVTIKIPFHDVDSMNFVWHGHYAKYLEIARCALLDQFNYNYIQMKEGGHSWPIVHLHTKYIRPLFFEQEIKVEATLVEYENCIKIKYLISDAKTGEKLSKAETMQVAVDMKTGETCFVSPDIFLGKVGEFV